MLADPLPALYRLRRSQPFVDGRDEDGRLVADREFVVPRGHGPVPFEAINAALDRVPGLVVLRVELWRPTATRAAFLAVTGLVGFVRDGAPDPAPPQVSAILPGGVRLVGAHAIWPGARPARPKTRDTDLVQDRLELWGIAPLPSRDHDRHGLLALLDSQVQLRGQAAARAPEPMVVRLDGDAAGRFLLQLPLFLAPAACWWARHTVESTLMSQVISCFASAWACSAVKI